MKKLLWLLLLAGIILGIVVWFKQRRADETSAETE